MSILRELAKTLERIDNKVDKLYEAMGPIVDFSSTVGVSMAFDKMIMEDLHRAMQSDLAVMETESHMNFVDGHTSYLAKKGVSTPEVDAARFIRERLPEIARQEIGNQLSIQKASATDYIHKAMLSAIDRIDVEFAKEIDRRNKETDNKFRKLQTMLDTALKDVEGLKKEFKDDIRNQVTKEITGVNNVVHEKVEALGRKSNSLLAEMETRYSDLRQIQKDLEVHLMEASGVTRKVNDRLTEAVKRGCEEIDRVVQKASSDARTVLESKAHNFENLLARVDQASKSCEVDFDKRVMPVVEELKEKLLASISLLEGKKHELEITEKKLNSSIEEVNKVAMRVQNTIPKTKQKVKINVQRNN